MTAAASPTPRRRLTTPDGTVAELVDVIPASPTGRGSSRTKARKRALDLLFEADLRGVDAVEVLTEHTAQADPPVRALTGALVEGVATREAEIDRLIADSLVEHWALDRMPRVDRCLARIAVWEMLEGSTSVGVAVQQAVVLAQELSTDESAAFLNGLLARVAQRIASSEA